jgi:CBS domain-containing protein
MQVRAGMSDVVLTVNPGHSLRDAARAMAGRGVGAAVVMDPEQPGPGIVTERDILQSIGQGQDPDRERVSDHLSTDLTFAAPDWSLERAAEAMVRGGLTSAGCISSRLPPARSQPALISATGLRRRAKSGRSAKSLGAASAATVVSLNTGKVAVLSGTMMCLQARRGRQVEHAT